MHINFVYVYVHEHDVTGVFDPYPDFLVVNSTHRLQTVVVEFGPILYMM